MYDSIIHEQHYILISCLLILSNAKQGMIDKVLKHDSIKGTFNDLVSHDFVITDSSYE